MDDSETLTIFIGHRCSDQLIQKLFGYVNVNSMPELIVSTVKIYNTLIITSNFLFKYMTNKIL